MNNDTKRELDEAAIDWAMGERVGDVVPPSLVTGVRERMAAASHPADTRSRARRFGIAAAVLLGTLVVAAVAWSRTGHREVRYAAVALQDPSRPARVSSRALIEALPVGTRYVAGDGLQDEDLPALLRLRDLESLRLSALPPSLPNAHPHQSPYRNVSDDGLRMLVGMPKLRSLTLFAQTKLTGRGLEALAHLPALEELTLYASTAEDEALTVLSQIPKLKLLHLPSCEGIGKATIERISKIQTLRDLDLSECFQLQADWLQQLGQMQNLERLKLKMDIAVSRGLIGINHANNRGIIDSTLAAWTGMKSLRYLDLAGAAISEVGLRSIRTLGITELDLSHSMILPQAIDKLPPMLKVLKMRSSLVSYPNLGERLAKATPNLATLYLSDCAGINDRILPGLRKLTGLQALSFAHCTNFTPAAIPELRKFERLIALDVQGWKFLTDEHRVQLRNMPNLGRLATDAGLETLR
ncbi:MAG: hypothetical protein ACI85K_002093 [Hyphomicrobiaceae bacterium]|jgi:hypothetical protein